MSYDKQEVKDRLELEDVYEILDFLGGEPEILGDTIVSKTICHGGDTRKLYYYENTQLFKCYTGECGTFDIFELVQKVQGSEDLNAAVFFVVNFFNLQSRLSAYEEDELMGEDHKIFSRWDKIANIQLNREKIILPQIPESAISFLPQPIIGPWEREGISPEVCNFMDIRYDGLEGNIIIPHRDADGRLVGIRKRTLVQENEKYGKYRPWKDGKTMYNHPLAFNLYGLDKAKENIGRMRTAIVVESEKSVLQYMSYFGVANNICVAVCGSSLSKYQFNLLVEAGAQEIVIGFDRDFENLESEEANHVISKLEKIYDKYSASATISFLFDKEGILSYKASPLDHGPEKFLYLWRNRVIL